MTKEALHKIEGFVKIALSEIAELKQQLHEEQQKNNEKQASQDKNFEHALRKAADAMYSSDFINDDEEKKLFVKKAKEDSTYLARVVERVCNAADVAFIGKQASVKSSTPTNDPVIRRAFGYDYGYSLLDE